MNIFNIIWQKFKNIFTKKEKIEMLDVGKDTSDQERESFKKLLKVKFEKISTPKKKVESHICYGDGLGIKKKMEY